MINNCNDGWCNFDLENFHRKINYSIDFPFDLLDCIIQYIKTGCSSYWFNEKEKNFTLVLTPYNIYIISEKDNSYLYKFNINIENLIKEIINDIEENIDNWSYLYPSKELYKDIKNLLKQKLILLKRK